MKKLIAVLLMLCMLCTGFTSIREENEEAVSDAAETETPAEEETEAIDYTTGTPWLDVDLEGNVTADTPVNLKDNYALAVNKEAILTTEIPEGYSYGGTIMDVVLKQAEDLKKMFLGDEPESHDAKLAYHFYQQVCDWDTRNALGIAPLKERTDQIEAVSSIDEMTAYFLNVPAEEQLSVLWVAESIEDLADASHYILSVTSCELVLEDSAEYSKLTDFGAIKKEARSELARKVLVKLGYTEEEAAQKLDHCFAFETKLAPVIYTNEERNSADYYSRVSNYYSQEEFADLEGNLPIIACLEKLGYPIDGQYLVLRPEYITCLNELYTEENLPLIRDYLIVHSVLSSANLLDRECYEWDYECSNAISGSSGMLDDETVAASLAAEKLEWPVAQLYTETYLHQEDKDRILAMVDEILDAYHDILKEADFLSDETKEKAIDKLESIKPYVLYPDSWEKYECKGLEVPSPEDGGTLWQTMTDIRRYENEESVRMFSEPVDKEKWGQPPQVVNCFYYPMYNYIVILGAFTQGNIYNSCMSDEELYAKLGMVIGHEISHAFDRSGAQFDKDGNMISWWTEEDYAAFTERNEKLEAYFNAMHPWEGQDFYGSIMTGEACADMAGMKAALRAVAGRDEFDYDAFFRAYANLWLTKETLQRGYAHINDTHPMNYLRVNATLQQFDEFLDCYGIQEGDGMYLAPEDRVLIW